MEFFKKFFDHLKAKIKFFLGTFFVCFVLFLVPNVYALGSLNNEIDLEYGNTTYAYNWSSSTSWSSLSLTRPNLDVPYHTPYVTTGTYGISFGQFLNGILLPKHYYRITWVVENGGGTNCSTPSSWANQLRTGTGMGNSVQVSRTYFNFIGIQNNQQIFYSDGSVETGICAYTIVTAFSGNVSWINFPVNTSTTLNQEWFYFGYYIDDLGSTDTLSASDLNDAISSLQSSLNSNISSQAQNIINNQNSNTNSINSNVDDEFNKLMNKDHTYNNNASDNVPNKNDITNVTDAESDLISDLNLDASSLDVTLNANTTNFIWDIVTNLRSTNGKITLLFTSILSLAIIKMVLNR